MVAVYSRNKNLNVIAAIGEVYRLFSKTIEQVIKEAVLSEVSKLNGVVMNKN